MTRQSPPQAKKSANDAERRLGYLVQRDVAYESFRREGACLPNLPTIAKAGAANIKAQPSKWATEDDGGVVPV